MRFLAILLLFFTCLTYGQAIKQAASLQGVEVIGIGQVNVQADPHLFEVFINEHATSAVKATQSAEYKIALISQFIDKNASVTHVVNLGSLKLGIIYPNLSHSIDGVEVFTRLPNKRPVKINTKLNSKQGNSVNKGYARAAEIAASQRIVISVVDTNAAQRVIDHLMKVGVTHIQALKMSHAEYQKHYQQALNLALANAKLNAKKIEESLEISLAEIIAVQEMPIEKNTFGNDTDKLKKYGHNKHQYDERAVNAQVKVIFAIKPR